MKMMETLDQENKMENNFKHLNFVIQFFIKLSYYEKTE